MKLDPRQVQQDIANLILQYPELAEDDVLRADCIEAETDAFDFLSQVVRRIGNRQALANGIADYAKDIGERKARVERSVEALRSLVFKIMNAAGLPKAELPEATLSICNGTPKVVITDDTAIPENYTRVVRSPDKTAIKDALARGEVVTGAVLSNSEPTLTIRIK